ncbi:DUF1707 domain-containing protein [Mycobacterium sp. 1274756.6]|uniref:DUF1707 domain-containing protein n=1 Tax=Mycobacterium sp. 1274756.6 TaxID=1834076 RepID=UPI0007FEED4D|nr:DUF1707 domain-containing protein [Mycobacterium sp. 1274756.6]OBJ69547.1 hypothetical protein A5643_01380 [Mycobacterium sp. 1274756.6]
MSTDVVAARTMRVGDRQRERLAARLGQALEQGYLSIAEYDARMAEAFAARTAGALDELVADLPVERIRRSDPLRRAAHRRAARRGVWLHVAAYLAVSVLMIGIWAVSAAVTGAGYFWPVWPILGWGIGVVSHAVPVLSCAGTARPAPPRAYWR